MANSVDPDQTAPIGAVCSVSILFASVFISSVMLGNYLQQTTSSDDIFRCIFFLGALRVNIDFRICPTLAVFIGRICLNIPNMEVMRKIVHPYYMIVRVR